ncbi:neural cell adhesion molecule 1-B-like [Mizuhopecten yessoensis]|uniref:neural cell adhesion molecule 1-B-like n=1 Tax=Mizuhopecten yessoensis TaxID=6573 RepID=UPI000B45C27A|nr:neural cell adhesion molecule 1-B-like [Mizuhopecten yessoensis]
MINVSASPAINSVTWQRVFTNGSRQNITVDGINYGGSLVSSPSLVIYNVDSIDAGSYVCLSTNSLGTGESGVMDLTVRGSIPSVSINSSAYDVTLGGTALLQASATASAGWEITTIYWKRTMSNNVTITLDVDGDKYEGGTISSPSLVVHDVDSGDEGNYVCYAVNSIGISESGTISLSVIGSKYLSYAAVTSNSADATFAQPTHRFHFHSN